MTVTHHGPLARRLAAVMFLAPLIIAACGSAATPSPSSAPAATDTPVPSYPIPSYTLAPAPSGCPTAAPDIVGADYTATVTMGTPFGNIVMKLHGAYAQHAVPAFVALAKCGYYDNVIFHRVVKDFVIQAGDGQYGRLPLGPDVAKVGQGGAGFNIKDDPVLMPYKRGVVAMARGSGKDSENGQFFIVLNDSAAKSLGDPSANNYAIIGEVTSGMDVVDKIASVPTTVADVQQQEQSYPLFAVPILGMAVTTP